MAKERIVDVRKLLYRFYLLSPRWLILRSLCKARDLWMCRRCFSRQRLQAHHKSYRYKGAPGRAGMLAELSDLITLCDTCHGKEHFK